jgi:hypothetical protein
MTTRNYAIRTLFAMTIACTASAFAADDADTTKAMPTHEHNKATMQGESHQKVDTTKNKEEVKATHGHNKVVMPGETHEKRETSDPSGSTTPTHQHNKVTMPDVEHSSH